MTEDGFWASGPDEHRRAFAQRIQELSKRLENCAAEEREQILREITDAKKEMRDADDGQILW